MAPGDAQARFTYLAYRAGAAVAVALPERLTRQGAGLLGAVLGLAMRGRRTMLARHLRRVHGPGLTGSALDRAVNRTFRSYARYWLEVFRLTPEVVKALGSRITVEGWEHVEAALAGGRGSLVITPHMGNWDLGGAFMASGGYRPVTVVEALEPPELFEWFCANRRRLGMEVVPVGDSAGSTLLRAIEEGRVAGLLSDRDLTGTGVGVEFFGERTTLPAGPATLALRARVDIIPGALLFEGPHHYRLIFRPPVPVRREARLREDIARITQLLAAELETLVRRAPEQWHLLQPNWPSDFEAAGISR
ncbi:MAG: phosphatidylinositol mannoside acyltransferase [Acidimicrobiia bacterium]